MQVQLGVVVMQAEPAPVTAVHSASVVQALHPQL